MRLSTDRTEALQRAGVGIPKTVSWSAIMTVALSAFNLIVTAGFWVWSSEIGSYLLILSVLNVAWYALLAVKIYEGRNWARITQTALYALGILASIVLLIGEPNLVYLILGPVAPIAIIAILALLWTGPSNAFFVSARSVKTVCEAPDEPRPLSLPPDDKARPLTPPPAPVGLGRKLGDSMTAIVAMLVIVVVAGALWLTASSSSGGGSAYPIQSAATSATSRPALDSTSASSQCTAAVDCIVEIATGDCLWTDGVGASAGIRETSCTSSEAHYKVITRIDAASRSWEPATGLWSSDSRCSSVPGTTAVFVFAENAATVTVLCLGRE